MESHCTPSTQLAHCICNLILMTTHSQGSNSSSVRTQELSRPPRPSGLRLCHLPILGGSPFAATLLGPGAFRHHGGQQGHFSSGESQRWASRPDPRVSRCVTKPGFKSRNSFMNMLITLSGLPPTICLNLNIIYLMDCTDMCQSK